MKGCWMARGMKMSTHLSTHGLTGCLANGWSWEVLDLQLSLSFSISKVWVLILYGLVWFCSSLAMIQVPEALGLSYKLANQLNQNHWYSASWIAKVHSKGDCDGWGGFWCLFLRHYWVHSKSIQRPKLCSLPGFYSWKALCRWGQDDTTVPWYVHREMVVGYPGMSWIHKSETVHYESFFGLPN